MKRTISIIASIIIVLTSASAAIGAGDAGALRDSLALRLAQQRYLFPQEKVHLTTDQNLYTANDTVWFRAWVVDAVTHRQVAASKYVYVELLSPFGQVVDRLKIRHEEGDSLFAGYLPLDAGLAEGDYTLAAYTTFMESLGPEYFFRKPLRILSPFGAKEDIVVEVAEQTADDAKLRISCVEKNGSPRHYEQMTVTTASGKQSEGGRGSRSRMVHIARKDCPGRTIRVQFDNHVKYVTLPPWPGEMDVTFHPEGGYLIPGIPCKVGFKAIDGAGRGIDVDGAILAAGGDTITSFSSAHRGIGTLVMVPRRGERYRAVVNGREFELPAPDADAAVLHVSQLPRALVVEAVGRVPRGALLVVQQRGVLQYAGEISAGQPLTINPAGLDPGVVQLLLLTSSLEPLSSRLIFINPE